MSSKENLEKAINQGKTLMKTSKDKRHEWSHISAVEKTALAVLKELKQINYPGIESISPELVSVVVWWHDCYKASLDKFSGQSNFNEGYHSAKIAREHLSDLLSEGDLNKVCEAIRYHAGIDLAPYFWRARSKSVLHKILIEADAYDMIRVERIYEGYDNNTGILERLWVIIDLLQTLILFIYLRTKVTRKDLWKRFLAYWGMMFWKEWYFFKIMFNRT